MDSSIAARRSRTGEPKPARPGALYAAVGKAAESVKSMPLGSDGFPAEKRKRSFRPEQRGRPEPPEAGAKFNPMLARPCTERYWPFPIQTHRAVQPGGEEKTGGPKTARRPTSSAMGMRLHRRQRDEQHEQHGREGEVAHAARLEVARSCAVVISKTSAIAFSGSISISIGRPIART